MCSGESINMFRISSALTAVVLLLLDITTPRAQESSFTPVEDEDLATRMASAMDNGRTRRGRFWTAWPFDVRPGVAVDIKWVNTNGSTSSIGVMMGGELETWRRSSSEKKTPGISRVLRFTTWTPDASTTGIQCTGSEISTRVKALPI